MARTRYQADVGGLATKDLPAAALRAVLREGYGWRDLRGDALAGLTGGLILIALGLGRLGRFIEFMPHPVTTGFTAGIAVVIATLQLKDVLGVKLATVPGDVFGRFRAIWQARATISLAEVGIAALTLTLLLGAPRLTRRVPAPLIALPVAAVAAAVLAHLFPDHAV